MLIIKYSVHLPEDRKQKLAVKNFAVCCKRHVQPHYNVSTYKTDVKILHNQLPPDYWEC